MLSSLIAFLPLIPCLPLLTDLKVNSVLRNFLFGSPTAQVRFGLDLAAINIQRGRDHGLPNYNAARRFYNGKAATSFGEISTDITLTTKLRSLYGNINNIDLWVGLLAEDRLPGKSIGKTMHAMLKYQFEKLRDVKISDLMSEFARQAVAKKKFREVDPSEMERNEYYEVYGSVDTHHYSDSDAGKFLFHLRKENQEKYEKEYKNKGGTIYRKEQRKSHMFTDEFSDYVDDRLRRRRSMCRR